MNFKDFDFGNINSNTHEIAINPKKIEDPEDAKLRRFVYKGAFLLFAATISIILGVSIGYVAFHPNSPSSSTAMSALLSVAAGLGGFFTGKVFKI